MMIHFISIRAKNGSTFLLDPFYFREGTTIPVSALVGGEQGNIPAHYLDGVYIFSSAMFVSASNAPDGPVYNQNSELFTGDSTVYIQNPKPFTGGKDSSTFPVVYHQDLEDVKKSFEETLTLQAQSDLAKQVTGGKHIVPGSPIECKTTTTSQPTIGQPATRTSVTVLVTCSTNIYDQKNLLATTTKLQEAELAKSYGPGYVPHGEPEIKYGKPGSKDVKIDDTLKTYTTLTLVRSGNWIYNINPQQMAQDFAGKPLWWVNRELGTMDDLLSYSVASSGIGGALPYSSSNINVEVMR